MSTVLSLIRDVLYFENPEYLLLLPFVGVVLLFGLLAYLFKIRSRPAKTYGSTYPFIGKIKLWFFATAALSVMVVAAARPYFVYGALNFERGNVEVPVVLDISASMWIDDIGGSRLDLAVREIINLYAEDILKDGDRVGLFVFGSTAVRKVHMSPDGERFIQEVGRIRPPTTLTGDAFPWDTDPAAAFERVYQSLDSQDRFAAGGGDWQPTRRNDRLVLVFSDGDYAPDLEQRRRLDEAMGEFQRRGLSIYPVGVGSRAGRELSEVLQSYEKGVDYDEQLEEELEGIWTQLDPGNLSFLEQRSGGRQFVIDSEGVDASQFLRRVIDSHRSLSFDLVADEDKQEVWQYLAGLALLVFAVAIFFY